MRVLFIGKDGVYSVRSLKAIAERHQIVGVVESLPRSFGRAAGPLPLFDQLTATLDFRNPKQRLSRLAKRFGAPFLSIDKKTLASLAPFIESTKPDVVCIASMSQLVPKEALSLPPKGFLNMHPSLLPKYRGPNPWYWQFHFFEPEWGVSIVGVDEGSDTGDIYRQEAFAVAPGTTFSEVLDTASRIGARLFVEALDDVAAGRPGKPQRHLPCPFYARRAAADEKLVDWTWPIERTWHVVRGGRRWLPELPSPGGLGRHVSWAVGPYERGANAATPGTLGRDLRGYYLNHAEGKIRICPDWGLKGRFDWRTPDKLVSAFLLFAARGACRRLARLFR